MRCKNDDMLYAEKIKELNINIQIGASLRRYNTFKLEQESRSVIRVNNEDDLIKVIEILKESKERFMVIGKGSNILFTRKSRKINFIVLTGNFNDFSVEENGEIKVGAGMGVVPFSVLVAKMGYAGLEFAHGIPGSIGGAVVMNAGAHGSEFSKVLKAVKVYDPKYETIRELSVNDIEMKYRNTNIRESGYIVLSATLELEIGNEEYILEKTIKNKNYRMDTQPLKKRTCGSVFKNPYPDYSAKLIEECGLKGYSVGGAKFSEKHANFIEVDDTATYRDVLNLIGVARSKVLHKKGIILEEEVKII